MTTFKAIFVAPLKRGWDILRTVYWYNSLPWRILKSGALVVLGFFCLSGGNLLHSFKPEWDFLNFIMAYGFTLILYGPIHHLIVIPVSLRLNHYDAWKQLRLGKRVPFWTLIGYFTLVIVLGFYPPEAMMFEFGALTRGSTPDVNPTLTCEQVGTGTGRLIRCRVGDTEGIHIVEVENKGRVIATDRTQPFEFSFREEELEAVVGQKQFQVIMRDRDGSMLRRFVRTATMVNGVEPGASPGESRD